LRSAGHSDAAGRTLLRAGIQRLQRAEATRFFDVFPGMSCSILKYSGLSEMVLCDAPRMSLNVATPFVKRP